jgi:hypothetical protein
VSVSKQKISVLVIVNVLTGILYVFKKYFSKNVNDVSSSLLSKSKSCNIFCVQNNDSDNNKNNNTLLINNAQPPSLFRKQNLIPLKLIINNYHVNEEELEMD